MEGIRRRVHHLEQEKFDREVEEEFQRIKLELDEIQIDVEPNDVEITSTRRGFWEHEITNNSPFEVVVRLRATSSYLFAVDFNVFRIFPNQTYNFRITRSAHRIRSHHIKLDVTRFVTTFQSRSLHDYFVGPYPHKTFVIRYHGAPRYWQDALEMNDWCPDKEFTGKVGQEVKKSVKEEKLDEADNRGSLITQVTQEYSERQVPEEENAVKTEANMNLANVMMMAMQDIDEESISEPDSEGDYESVDYKELVGTGNGIFEQLIMHQPSNE